MMVPPQMWMGPYCTLTCQGHLLTEVSFPPMMRPEILCPQAGGESRVGRRARGGKHAQIPTTPGTPGGAQCIGRGSRPHPESLLGSALFAQAGAKKEETAPEQRFVPISP